MKDIIGTKTEIREGIKYTTHYVDRPIRQGDPHGGPVGTVINGVSKTTEIIQYVYKLKFFLYIYIMVKKNLIHYLTPVFASVLLAVVLFSCTQQPIKEPKEVIEYKVVKDKKEKIETEYEYVYSILKGDFVLQPNIQTKYYIIYADGSYDKVELRKYSITEIGDSIINKKLVY